MRLGLIARADSRGLGIQTKAVHDQLHPARTMVIDCPSAKPLPIRHDWYPDATWITGLPTRQDIRKWLRGLDVVYTAETGYGDALWREARNMGVKTVLHCNPEFLNRRDQPDLWLAPTRWMWDTIPTPKRHLPVPVDPAAFPPRRPEITPHFLHIVGRPAIHDRNGTLDLLLALQHVTEQITVTVRCQDTNYVPGLMKQHRVHTPNNVVLRVETGDVEHHTDLYTDGDILVMPRRFGGLCLPAQEAIAAGMPVLMPDIAPNNQWLPKEWLFPAEMSGSFVAKQRVDYYRTKPRILAAKLDAYATMPPSQWSADVERIRQELSWETLRPSYIEVLTNDHKLAPRRPPPLDRRSEAIRPNRRLRTQQRR